MEQLKAELKTLIIQRLNLTDVTPQHIEDDAVLFGPQSVLGLDSIDAIQMAAELQAAFPILTGVRPSFENFNTINQTAQWLTSLGVAEGGSGK